MTDETYKVIQKEEKGSQVELEIEVPASVLERFRTDAVKSLSEDIEIDGFRKGTAPEKLVVAKVGEMAVAEKAAYNAINNIVPIIIAKEELEALTMPSISITKIAPMGDLVFKMGVTLLPKVVLPDYKAIAKNIPREDVASVEEKEVEEYIDYIRTQRAQAAAKAEQKTFDTEKDELPAFDDEFVKTLGAFESVDDFKKKLLENMEAEKKQKVLEKRRLQIIEKIIDETKTDVPDIMIEEELERMFAKFRHDIQNFKMDVDEYLKELKKTTDDLKKEWRPDAVKRVKMQLVLPTIAAQEKIKADEAAIEKELEHILEHDASIDASQARPYIANVLMNEAVFTFLEAQQ